LESTPFPFALAWLNAFQAVRHSHINVAALPASFSVVEPTTKSNNEPDQKKKSNDMLNNAENKKGKRKNRGEGGNKEGKKKYLLVENTNQIALGRSFKGNVSTSALNLEPTPCAKDSTQKENVTKSVNLQQPTFQQRTSQPMSG
jgi:hypothetical protein